MDSYLLGVLTVLIFVIICEGLYILLIKNKENETLINEIDWKAKNETINLTDDQLKSNLDKEFPDTTK